MDYYKIAIQAVKTVIVHTFYRICDDDYNDMLQTAVMAIWQLGQDKSEALCVHVAKIAARGWLVWWKYGSTRDKLFNKVNSLHGIQPPASFDDIEENELRRTCPRSPLPDWEISGLREIFYKTRHKHSPKELAAIERDIYICKALAEECEPIGIGQDLGLTPHMVNNYRTLLRGRLSKYIESINV